MLKTANLGYPRIGLKRELKKGLESYWSGKIDQDELGRISENIRRYNWLLQKNSGMDTIPSNDFSLYDHVLDTIAMLGAVPVRYGTIDGEIDLDHYFSMARGRQLSGGKDLPAMEMTKWFDTNYHYIVPEFNQDQRFQLSSLKPIIEYRMAKTIGIETRPVILGPVSFLLLGKMVNSNHSPINLLDGVLPVYEGILSLLKAEGAEWLQMDEPFLVMDLSEASKSAYRKAYSRLAKMVDKPRIMITTYFGSLAENRSLVFSLPVDGVHVDLVRAPTQVDSVVEAIPGHMTLSMGVVDGRNIWKTDLSALYPGISEVVEQLGSEKTLIAPSCSLMHVPQDLSLEVDLDEQITRWMAFSRQKLEELSLLAKAINHGWDSVSKELAENQKDTSSRLTSTLAHNQDVKKRVSLIDHLMKKRKSDYPKRRSVQQAILKLPKLPTTTIGSFPQTSEVRKMRADLEKGLITEETYKEFLHTEIEQVIRFQEEIGLDVLVHGEFERNDMVQYFAEQLSGFAFTRLGWVQSFGSRYVRPPIIYGDVYREKPISVEWSQFAQSLTKKPVKGMLTGPVTILKWSFAHDDQPDSETCFQIALAIRDEVIDLENAGIKVIQIDEPAMREGLPLRKEQRKAYLDWAVDAFLLASSAVGDHTQVHTHMCYAEFNDILESIAKMDADVISIEASRSNMTLFDAFGDYQYPNEIGPGVYDIHSPRVPTKTEIKNLLIQALKVIPAEKLWVNPDCGLKTRKWEEIRPALIAMVEAAQELRQDFP